VSAPETGHGEDILKHLKQWGALLGALAFAQPAMAVPQREGGLYPRDVSVDGHRIDWLINITAIFVGILFVIMVALMIGAIVKHGRSHKAEYDHGTGTTQVMVACGISAAIFFIVDGNLFVNSVIDLSHAFWNFGSAENNPQAVRIEINAHQWAWDARYPGPDNKFNTEDDIVTLNDIRIPKGVPVIFQLGSVDVIHSFYAPNLRQKIDVVPGNITHLWFEAKETGEFDIGCAQHCGTHHYKMRAMLTILDPPAYQAWFDKAVANAKASWDPKDEEAHWGWPWVKDYY
jgi:cytochrome c oxidase subunit 2